MKKVDFSIPRLVLALFVRPLPIIRGMRPPTRTTDLVEEDLGLELPLANDFPGLVVLGDPLLRVDLKHVPGAELLYVHLDGG